MKLVIIKEHFELNRILFRQSKNSIKISYNINNLSMIGITMNIDFENLLDKGTYIILKVCEKDKKILKMIDEYFSSKISDYDKMIIKDSIKVKKHNEYTMPNKKITLSINSIKRNQIGRNKVQIFSI